MHFNDMDFAEEASAESFDKLLNLVTVKDGLALNSIPQEVETAFKKPCNYPVQVSRKKLQERKGLPVCPLIFYGQYPLDF